jgi:hypothetical protein
MLCGRFIPPAILSVVIVLLWTVSASCAEKTAPPTFPAAEELRYTINWPTGLSLGEATLRTVRRKTDNGPRIESEFSLDASVPGFAVLDHYRAIADGEYCSLQLEKEYQHGKKKSEERTTIDPSKRVATRQTLGGGSSEINVAACAKDALTYLQYLRRELSQGRLPPHQSVLFGAEYRVSVQFAGTQNIVVSEKRMEADRLNVTLKGPAADVTFEAYFAKDAVRTPVMIRVPMTLATFSMELSR